MEISHDISRHNRTTSPIVQANTGGIGPKSKQVLVETNMADLHEDMPREEKQSKIRSHTEHQGIRRLIVLGK